MEGFYQKGGSELSELLKRNEMYKIVHGDCIKEMANMPEKSVDFSVYSPPFSADFRVYVAGKRPG